MKQRSQEAHLHNMVPHFYYHYVLIYQLEVTHILKYV